MIIAIIINNAGQTIRFGLNLMCSVYITVAAVHNLTLKHTGQPGQCGYIHAESWKGLGKVNWKYQQSKEFGGWSSLLVTREERSS